MLARKKFIHPLLCVAVIVAQGGFILACSSRSSGDQITLHEARTATRILVDDQRPEIMNAALALQQIFRDVARVSVPTVVRIDTATTVPSRRFGRSFEQPGGTGSGVIYDREGKTYYVLTNAHVIQNTNNIRLTLHEGTEYRARLVGADSSFYDIAVLEFESDNVLTVAALGDSDTIVVGDQVLAVGSPFGFQSTVTSGIISGLGREQSNNPLAEYIQTDASINPGNSGGALIALDGLVIAINTWIASRTGGSDGIGFALPINTAVRIAEQLRGGGVRPGYLGVMIEDLSSFVGQNSNYPTDGVLAWSVFIDSPADIAGLLPGDLLTAIDGQSIDNRRELLSAIAEAGAGTSLTLTVERAGVSHDLRIQLAERHEQQTGISDWPGIAVAADPSGGGIVVRGVTRTSGAARVGLRPGDVITRVDGRKVTNVAAFYDVVAGADEVGLRVKRAGITETVTISR